MTKKIAISKKTLENLYCNEKLSTYKIAKELNCDPTVIQNRLREYKLNMRFPKKRIDISKERLKKLYWEDGLSSYKLAEILGVGRTTVYNKLIEYGLGTRPKKLMKISENELERLYNIQKMPLSQIAELYGCSSSAILNKMKQYKIKRRNMFESNQTYPKRKFTGDQKLKAYMVGFRLGDLNVISKGEQAIIFIKSSTTRKEQFNLIKKIYGKYGHFNYKKFGGVYQIYCNLDNSFKFLIKKEDDIEEWILKNKTSFLSFLGGYIDAEGSFGVYQNKGRFRIGTYDKNILKLIKNELERLGIKIKFNLEKKSQRGFNNKDFYRVSINDKKSLKKFIKVIKPYVKHTKRLSDMLNVENNVLERIKNSKNEGKIWLKKSSI